MDNSGAWLCGMRPILYLPRRMIVLHETYTVSAQAHYCVAWDLYCTFSGKWLCCMRPILYLLRRMILLHETYTVPSQAHDCVAWDLYYTCIRPCSWFQGWSSWPRCRPSHNAGRWSWRGTPPPCCKQSHTLLPTTSTHKMPLQRSSQVLININECRYKRVLLLSNNSVKIWTNTDQI